MKHFNRKRLALVGGAVTTVGAGAALLAGATFGFFSSAGTAGGTNTFTAGTVFVDKDTTTQVTCNAGPMSPGDTQSSGVGQLGACEYDIVYTGDVDAYLGLDVVITGTDGTPVVPYGSTIPSAAHGLYDGTSTGLQVTISDGTNTYVSGTTYNTQVLIATPATLSIDGSGEAAVSKLLMNTAAVNVDDTRHLTVSYTLPTGAGNAYNDAASTIQLRVHAVQYDHVTLPGTCSVGHVCSAGMTWN
ncbi:MAG: hypothetical protein QOE93_972 [Actinomycetota bacterium]|nr:hypothetical protein [Actinomycetota bacterium]